MLNRKEVERVLEFLSAEFADIVDNLDYHTDSYGNIILTSQSAIRKVLKVV